MSKFTDMMKSDVEKVFLNTDDFADSAVYSYENQSIQCNVVLNCNVELIGEHGQVGEKITTIKLSSDVDISVGGVFSLLNGDIYKIDAPISNDGFAQTVSVVKQ